MNEVFICEGSPREMGQAQGEAFRLKIPEIFKAFFHSPYPPPWLKKYGKPVHLHFLFSLLGFKRYPSLSKSLGATPNQKERFLGIAKGARIGKRTLASLNSIEITSTQLQFVLGCAALGFAPSRLKDHATPLIAYNHDFPDFFEDFLILRKSKPSNEHASLQLTYPILTGAIAGVNEKGVAVTLNHAFAVETGGPGIPPTMLVQEVLDKCVSTEEGIRFLKSVPPACGSMITLVDQKGDMATVELSRTRTAVRRGAKGGILTLNRYETSSLRAIEVPAEARFHPKKFPPMFHGMGIHDHNRSRGERFDCLLKEEPLTLDEIRSCMRDHGKENTPDSSTICRHHDTARTIASALIYPAERKMEVIRGNPCKGEYREYTL